MGEIDLSACHMVETTHLNGGREWFGYMYRCVEHPRLQRLDRYQRSDRSVTSTWRVDGQDVASLDAARAALAVPPVLTEEERTVLALVSEEPVDLRRSGHLPILMALTDKGMLQWSQGKVSRTAAARSPRP